jgi:Fe-S cluster biosynthesis and repair protein YggX
LKQAFQSATNTPWDEVTSRQYITYFINKNFLSFFDRERRETLEKHFVIDYTTIALPGNTKQNVFKVLQ